MWAAWYGWEATIEALLHGSSNTEVAGADGETALLKAVWAGHPRAVALLLAHGARADAKNRQKKNALEICKYSLENLEQDKERLSHFFNVEEKKQEYLACKQLLEDELLKKHERS